PDRRLQARSWPAGPAGGEAPRHLLWSVTPVRSAGERTFAPPSTVLSSPDESTQTHQGAQAPRQHPPPAPGPRSPRRRARGRHAGVGVGATRGRVGPVRCARAGALPRGRGGRVAVVGADLEPAVRPAD